jgi:LuxR family maltose regulon positive regulatory protein
MAVPILKTKLYIPPIRAEFVPRSRLMERLNEGVRSGRRLTLISAPAGFGKTTLVSEWIRQSDSPAAWLSLDQGDNDPVRFWAYVIAALQTVCPGVGQGVLTALQSPRPPSIELLLTSLINEIASQSAPLVLVLDDLHLIASAQVHEGIVFLLDHLPGQMHVVLSSRADPPWPLARRRARGEMAELRASDLRFTPGEAAAFLNDVMELGFSAEDIAALDARTEGWIAGLQLVAIAVLPGGALRSQGAPQSSLSMRGKRDVSAFVRAFSGSHRLILDYLVEEVLDRQSPAVQAFLLQTSILERMTAPLCDAVVEIGKLQNQQMGKSTNGQEAFADGDATSGCLCPFAGSQAFLEQLDRANLFLVPLDGERRWYRYHHLFADLLRSRLYQTQPDQVPVLHRQASEWYETQALMDEAITHALAAKDVERAADLVERSGMQMIMRSELSTLARWLEELPGALVRARPWLCIYHAWARYYVGPREQVEPRLQDAEHALQAAPGTGAAALTERARRHIAGHVAALRAYMALQNEELGRVAELAQRALDLLPKEDYARATSAIALAETPRERGDLMASERAYARAREIAEECGNVPMAVSAVAYMAYQQAKQGRLHEAYETNREALALAVRPDGRQLPAAGLPYVKMGDLMREWNDLEAACRYLEKGIELCLQWGHADALVTGYTTLARVQLAQGEPARARDTFDKAEQLARKTDVDPWAICWIDDCRLRLWLAADGPSGQPLGRNLAAAASWAEASGLAPGDALSFVRDLEHVNLARVLVAQGVHQPDPLTDPSSSLRTSSGQALDEALALLARLSEAAEGAGWIGRAIEILCLRSLALRARGDDEEALSALARALALAEPEGYVRTFLDEGLPMGKLLREMAARGIAVDYVSRLLVALEGEAKGQRQKTEAFDSSFAPSLRSGQAPSAGSEQTTHPSSVLVEPLTGRERQVLRLLATNLTSPEIAQELVVSANTVRTHVRHIYDKLMVHSRYEAVQRARELDLL